MASPSDTTARRPDHLPADARWDGSREGFEWVQGAVDDQGRHHGEVKSWDREGVLHGLTHYDRGVRDGVELVYHPDGTIASQSVYKRGVLYDRSRFRPRGPSKEPWPKQVGAGVHEIRETSRDGKTVDSLRYFAADGTEVGSDGVAVPSRPASVPPAARWSAIEDRWIDGAYERDTERPVGHWQWWAADGTLRLEEHRDERGEIILALAFDKRGQLERRTACGPHGEEDEWFHDNGKPSARYRDDSDGRRVYEAHWAKSGTLEEEMSRTFDGDDLESVTERGRSGVLAFEAKREGSAMACVLYREDGSLAAAGLVKNDRLLGSWRLFDTNGKLRREIEVTALGIEQECSGDGMPRSLGEALFRLDGPTLELPPQLQGVDDEPWHDSPSESGDATQLPRLLRAAVSNDRWMRDYALFTIECEIVSMSTTHPATARTLPYLARLLAHPDVDRARLLAIIQEAGEAAWPYIGRVKHLDEKDPDRISIEGTCNAIASAWPLVWRLLPTATPAEKRRILVIGRVAPEAQDDLLSIAKRDPDPLLRACAIDSLAAMKLEVTETFIEDPDLLVRVAASIAVACWRGPITPVRAVDVLGEALEAWPELAPRFAELPYLDGHLLSHVAIALGSMRSSNARTHLPALCKLIDELDPISAAMYAQGVLALTFGTGERPFAPGFIDVLDALARSEQFWRYEVNASAVLDRWRLPGDEDALAALVSELSAAADAEAALHVAMHGD